MIELRHEVKKIHKFDLYYNGELAAVLEATPIGKDLEIHNAVLICNHHVLKAMRDVYQSFRAECKQMGYKNLVAIIKQEDMTDKLRKFRKFFGFNFETVQRGYNCAVMEV